MPQTVTATESARRKEVLRLWLRLLGSTRTIEQHLKARLRSEFGVTLAQFDLMAEIARGDTPKTMSQVSELLMISNGNVTGLVDRLSQGGLVRRSPSKEDRRVNLLSLTPEGKRLFKEMAARHEVWLEKLFEGLEPEFVAALGGDIKRLRDALKAATEGDTA